MTTSKQFIGYVGTYTKGSSKGIYTFTLDTEAGKISEPKVAVELSNPTYVTVSNDNKYLFAVAKEGESGGVAAFEIDSETGALNALNSQVLAGSPPCHVSVSSDNRHVFSANYHKGTVEYYVTNEENGTINPPASIAQHEGTGPNKERQEKPHTHFAGLTPDEKYVAAVDLGIDKVITYEITEGNLTEVSSLSVKPGSGPRHLDFHPNGKYAYIMTELSNEVIVLQYNPADGSFTELQYIPAIPEDFTENSQGSAIHVTSDGRFVYAGNRGHNSIAVFRIDSESGKLSFIEHTSTEGNWPRDFVLDPTEAFLVASNEKSENLVLYARDKSTGKLTLLQSDIPSPEPVCVKFLHA